MSTQESGIELRERKSSQSKLGNNTKEDVKEEIDIDQVSLGATPNEKKIRSWLKDRVPYLIDENNPIGCIVSMVLTFISDSRRFIQACTKPDQAEFKKIASMCGIGFGVMGFIGYTVKLVFIPINNIMLGGAM